MKIPLVYSSFMVKSRSTPQNLGRTSAAGAYSVSVRRLDGPNDDALDLGSTLRLVPGCCWGMKNPGKMIGISLVNADGKITS